MLSKLKTQSNETYKNRHLPKTLSVKSRIDMSNEKRKEELIRFHTCCADPRASK